MLVTPKFPAKIAIDWIINRVVKSLIHESMKYNLSLTSLVSHFSWYFNFCLSNICNLNIWWFVCLPQILLTFAHPLLLKPEGTTVWPLLFKSWDYLYSKYKEGALVTMQKKKPFNSKSSFWIPRFECCLTLRYLICALQPLYLGPTHSIYALQKFCQELALVCQTDMAYPQSGKKQPFTWNVIWCRVMSCHPRFNKHA